MKTVCQTCNGTGWVRDEKAFGATMQAKRKAAKATLQDVAKRMELSIGYISDLEHGRKRWRGGLIIAYVNALSQNGNASFDKEQ
jgi:transcriptional regulator with XRE-family HTH domain